MPRSGSETSQTGVSSAGGSYHESAPVTLDVVSLGV